MVRAWVCAAVMLAPLCVLAQDGGEPLDGAVADAAAADAALPDAAPLETLLLIAASTSDGPCAAPCRELTARPSQLVTLSGTAAGPGAGSVSLFWELAMRPAGSVAALSDPRAAQVLLTPDLEGFYEVALRGAADGGAALSASISIHATALTLNPVLTVRANDQVIACSPECPTDSIRIGTLVELDGSGSSHDPAHGVLGFAWQLRSPPGSTAELADVEPGVVSFRPDVDGAYEILMTVSDDRDSAELAASFIIPTVLNYEPLQCRSTAVPGGTPWGAVALAAGWLALCRRRRR
ncbi:MAG: hypothetical protein HY904_09010 [Deltaproteobacteria bacterium]|nr:hypothetical protein [Deltaproteobacteria bacterium]